MLEDFYSDTRENELVAYCVQCETGQESKVADVLRFMYKGITALAAQQEKHRSERGCKSIVRVNMLPGYVFIYSAGDVPFRSIMTHHNVYRFLTYGNAEGYALRGGDLDFAFWVFRNKGLFSCSQAVKVGTEVKIISGPLTDNVGTVEKVDRHNRNVCLAIQFDSFKRQVWMPFEWTSDAGNKLFTR